MVAETGEGAGTGLPQIGRAAREASEREKALLKKAGGHRACNSSPRSAVSAGGERQGAARGVNGSCVGGDKSCTAHSRLGWSFITRFALRGEPQTASC